MLTNINCISIAWPLANNLSLFVSSFCHYSSHPRLASIPHLLLSSNRKRQSPFGLALILLANGPLLIQWVTRSAPTALNTPDNKESGFPPLAIRRAGGLRPLDLVPWGWWNHGDVVLYSICVCPAHLHHAMPLCTFSISDHQVPEGGQGEGLEGGPTAPTQPTPAAASAHFFHGASFRSGPCSCVCVPFVCVGERQVRTWKLRDPEFTVCNHVYWV